MIEGLNNASKCNAIEGVQVSQEELEALKEAANAQADAPEFNDDKASLDMLKQEMNQMSLNEKKPKASAPV